MSFEQTEAFYQRIATDETFRSQFQVIENHEKFYYLARLSGYEFTDQEFEEYTAQLLETETPNYQIQDLKGEELASILGGFLGQVEISQKYGCVRLLD